MLMSVLIGLVTPFVGVWIETGVGFYWYATNCVTPFVGVWIETVAELNLTNKVQVTPFVGVWIETQIKQKQYEAENGHTLRGCVDWNTFPLVEHSSKLGHTLRGCVDWNCL